MRRNKMFDWNKYETRAKKMTVSELEFACKDCREAEKAMRGWNHEKESHYSDEASVYSAELRKRRQSIAGGPS
jgi:hypothetical protein